ncbi:hypothetical protein PRIPAC_78433 [Pristionchus pacificus]|uniref:Uncharacterized protein n=1 Tax=Pristionchus pacificus TaxID=54126 RepID=A0A2A6CJC2_PRIPA|nr:hypothetical protein PRIPAC_78433 [Pristionchus pacificus]|eukprot:PDM78229.1 hypothetical protein PRIPAC_30808 [Pristionchus pacificus]
MLSPIISNLPPSMTDQQPTASHPNRNKKEKQGDAQLTKKRVVDSAQFCTEIPAILLPEIANQLTPHLVQAIKAEVIPMIVDHVTSTIGPELNTMVNDYVNMLLKGADETKASIYNLSKQLSHSPIVPQSPSSIHSNSNYRTHRTPTSSRDHYSHRSNHRSRSRSPYHSIPRGRSRSRSRSPTRPFQQRKPTQCALCKGYNHLSKYCQETKSLSTRLSIMRSENRCLQCFRPLDKAHYPQCEPPLCHRGCKDQSGRIERYAEFFCPKNPNLTP